MKILTIFPYFAIYSEPLFATYASFGGGGSHITDSDGCRPLKSHNYFSGLGEMSKYLCRNWGLSAEKRQMYAGGSL